MFLRPGSTFKIVWQTADPNDATTYYPQAVIKKSLDSSVIDTVSLTLESAGRYSYNWQVPNDPTGQGLQIDVTVAIYTDSGHTTYSANYQKENRVYTIFDMAAALMRTGGGDNTDYRLIEKLIEKAIEKIIFPEVKLPDYSGPFGDIHKKLSGVESLITGKDDSWIGTRFDEHKTTMGKVFEELGSQKISHEQAKEQFLTGIQNLAYSLGQVQQDHKKELAALKQEMIGQIEKEVQKVIEPLGNKISEKLDADVANILTMVKGLSKVLSGVQTITMRNGLTLPKEMPREEEKPKKDYSEAAKRLAGIWT